MLALTDRDLKGEALTNHILELYEEAKRDYHDSFCQKVESRYKSYRGVLEKQSEAAEWRSKLHPPYIWNIVETFIANLLDDNPKFRVRPLPKHGSPEEVEKFLEGAEMLQAYSDWSLQQDDFDIKQNDNYTQTAVAGLSVIQTGWEYCEQKRKYLGRRPYLAYHPDGSPAGFISKLEEMEEMTVTKDQFCSEIVDVRDFIWPGTATSLDKAPWCIRRRWYTWDDILNMIEQGYLPKDLDLTSLRERRNYTDDAGTREQDLKGVTRTKDMIEFLEFWTPTREVVIANTKQGVPIIDRPNPYWHGMKPFIGICHSPDLFSIPGISVVEIVDHLQTALWRLMNQRIDNVELITNAIIKVANDLDSDEKLDFYPGAQWDLDRLDQVEMWQPNPLPAEISVTSENMIRGDIQNVTGGMPFLSGSDSQTVDQKTATGVSIITNLAQKVLMRRKLAIKFQMREFGQQMVGNLQQFTREQRLLDVYGDYGDPTFLEVDPEAIQGQYRVALEMTTESFIKQEKRAEAQALFTTFINAAPLLAQGGAPVDLRKLSEYLLEAFDVQAPERFFQQPSPMPALPGGVTPPGAGGGMGTPPQPDVSAESAMGGVTSDYATDSNSVSNPLSSSPAQFLHRMGSLAGAGRAV